jgi:hypothetical protein
MRTGVSLAVTSADMDRLRALMINRNARRGMFGAHIVLLSAEGFVTNAVMREASKSKRMPVYPQRKLNRTEASRRSCGRSPPPGSLPGAPALARQRLIAWLGNVLAGDPFALFPTLHFPRQISSLKGWLDLLRISLMKSGLSRFCKRGINFILF